MELKTHKKVGRPSVDGTAIGLKPRLSDKAIAHLALQKNKSAYIAELIEEDARTRQFVELLLIILFAYKH